MIQIQIASHITPLGVEGIRWVLVEPTESCSATGQPPAEVLTAALAPVEPSAEGNLLSMGVLKLGLTGLGLGLALWTAQAWLGAPPVPWLAPTADPRAAVLPLIGAVPTPTPPAATPPAATPPPDWPAPAAPAEPATSAPAAAPLVTAEL